MDWKPNETDRAIAQMQSLQSLLDNPPDNETERRAGDGSLDPLVGRRSVENSLLEQIRDLKKHFIAALAEEAGGELSVADVTLRTLDTPLELVTWEDKAARRFRVRVRKSQPPNEKADLPTPGE